MGNIHQSYADAIFEAASHRLGRWVAAPRVLHAFDDEPESVPVASQPALPAAYATEAASKSSYPPSTTSSSTSATETNSAIDRSVRALRSIANIFFLATPCGTATAICAFEKASPFSSYLIRIHPLPL